MNHGKSQLCVNIKHSDGRGGITKSRGLQRAASGAEEEDVGVGRRKQQRELGWGRGRTLNDRWEERRMGEGRAEEKEK